MPKRRGKIFIACLPQDGVQIMNLMIEKPTIERHLQRGLDALGYHDAKQIPVEVVFQLFEAFFKYENQWNENIERMFEDHMKFCTSLPPFVPLPNRESK